MTEKGYEYAVSKWALIRRNELVDIPGKLVIHPDYLTDMDAEELEAAFRQIHDIFYQIYTDIAKEPDYFGFPLYKPGEYQEFSKQGREVKSMPWDIFYLLLYLFSCGMPKNGGFMVDTEKFHKVNRVKGISVLLKALCDYGFVFSGLKQFKMPPSVQWVEIGYPDNRKVLTVLSLVAAKVMNTQLKEVKNHFSNQIVYSNAFIGWNYRILEEDMHTCSLAEGCDYVTDKLHSPLERETAGILHEALLKRGFAVKKGDSNEGPGMRYFTLKSQSVYQFAVVSMEGTLRLKLRIRNVQKCLDYLKQCPDRIKDMFRQTDEGCENRKKGICKYGVKYEFEGAEKWHCGCCEAPFHIQPAKEDMEHYFKLVEIGSKR